MKILEITKKNKKTSHKVLLGPKPVIMLFYWNQCGHCKMFEPTWKQIASRLDSKSGIRMCQIEYNNQTALPDTIKPLNSFPTVVAIQKGYIMQTYNGPVRTVDAIENFMRKYMSSI